MIRKGCGKMAMDNSCTRITGEGSEHPPLTSCSKKATLKNRKSGQFICYKSGHFYLLLTLKRPHSVVSSKFQNLSLVSAVEIRGISMMQEGGELLKIPEASPRWVKKPALGNGKGDLSGGTT
ncbi:MAG TPA: hypothetical protein DHT43_10245 [Deltaproteobacteria bacterium]|nr:hypothetical protein [Deltaproteobacteria bacterium]